MKNAQRHKTPTYKSLMRYAKILRFGDIHTRIDRKTGLHAIIAIHNTKLGPAIGGCRYYAYHTPELALKDAIRLAYGMTLKAAACGLPHGGAKSVIIKPKNVRDRAAMFRAFGDFIDELNGRYITALDVGTTLEDLAAIEERTPHVLGASVTEHISGDPSPYTARGVFRAIQAATKFKWQRDNLDGLHVAVQGVGRVGYHLTKHLIEDGAKVTVADTNQAAVSRCVNEFGVAVVDTTQIDAIDCDIFSPCAMGGIISFDMIHRTKAKIIAGAANNQLAHRKYARLLLNHDILYLPDFFINPGGLIYVATIFTHKEALVAEEKIDSIYGNTLTLLERAAKSDKTTTRVAEEIALEKLR